jgi:hypothetical protein
VTGQKCVYSVIYFCRTLYISVVCVFVVFVCFHCCVCCMLVLLNELILVGVVVILSIQLHFELLNSELLNIELLILK